MLTIKPSSLFHYCLGVCPIPLCGSYHFLVLTTSIGFLENALKARGTRDHGYLSTCLLIFLCNLLAHLLYRDLVFFKPTMMLLRLPISGLENPSWFGRDLGFVVEEWNWNISVIFTTHTKHVYAAKIHSHILICFFHLRYLQDNRIEELAFGVFRNSSRLKTL